MKAKLVKTEKGYHLDTGSFDGVHLACYPHDVTKQRLSLKNCQAIERGYDLDELAGFYSTCTLFISDEVPTEKQIEDAESISEIAFKAGFQKALELMGDKKFSEEDAISMIEKSRETGLTAQYLILTKQQTEWEVEVKMDAIPADRAPGGWDIFPELDADGCLILQKSVKSSIDI